MELVLNFAWVLLAAMMFYLWPVFAARNRPEQQTQNQRMRFFALAVLVLRNAFSAARVGVHKIQTPHNA